MVDGNSSRRERGAMGALVKNAPVFAALDLGTHNCRLLAACPVGDGFRVVDAFSRIVRLGEGLVHNDRLSEAAMDRAIDALKVCAQRMRRLGVSKGRNVATEACRRASNCDEFIERVQAETGLEIEIISPVEEARLALDGCATLLEREREFAVVFDIGGGSTELMWLSAGGRETRIEESMSLPYGVVTLAERYGGDRLSELAYREIVAKVMRRVAPFEERHQILRSHCGGCRADARHLRHGDDLGRRPSRIGPVQPHGRRWRLSDFR